MNEPTPLVPVADCHAKGIYSIPVPRHEGDRTRMFIDTLGLAHTVAPHNHRYSLTLTVIKGTLIHTVWKERSFGEHVRYEQTFNSPFNGGTPWFVPVSDTPRRWGTETMVLRPHGTQSIDLSSEDVHSLVTDPGTTWTVTELRYENDSPITLSPTFHYRPDMTGLYNKIEVSDD